MERDVYWRPVDSVGLEHLHYVETEAGVEATGLVLAHADSEPFHLSYRVACDQTHRVTDVELERLDRSEPSLALRATEGGNWTSRENTPIPAIEGCIDVDIAVTPFSNTIPIRRLGLDVGETARLSVAYVSVPALGVDRVTQRYTRLDDRPSGRRCYRYENLSSGFSANIPVDADGLVIDYPGAFDRVAVE
ncbi:hypothetical protein C479_10560 [Halovivax asiaticus JCM 14624]|uniref:Uncharacterized protein n=1 Tax=Halovivax asiaticus JCM 14624 TaxID=1227490 RepID=M0BED7_9EURY|nr:putative glycolipid-binding domain-containing protein [Halovivax asiaticus]ELZ09256.1 hypothetical protein C479_10560 [Halovivax asiaticus JCM 14624]